MPFVTRGEFIIPTTRGFATRGRNYPVPFPSPEGINPILFMVTKNYQRNHGIIIAGAGADLTLSITQCF